MEPPFAEKPGLTRGQAESLAVYLMGRKLEHAVLRDPRIDGVPVTYCVRYRPPPPRP